MENLFLVLYNIRWQDLIDIAISSYILFRLYVLFRGTYVIRVLIGFAMLLIFGRIAGQLELIVTSYAIQGILAVAALIIIVVFRNEIRSVLQATNMKSILWGFSHKFTDTPIDSIVDSVFELSQRKDGAIIVCPGKKDLKDFIQSSIEVRGKISSELLTSIFWHGNPLHDGAVILKDDKIMAAGAILPLTKREDLPSYYGTRHRAGIGLADQADALVIIVSEERGEIVVAKGLKVINIVSREHLVDILHNHLGFDEGEPEFVRREKTRIVYAAVISFLFVTSVWFSFARSLDTVRTVDVPIEYSNRQSDIQIFSTSVNSVQLLLSGSGTLIKSIRPEQMQIKFDLSDSKLGKNTYKISKNNISLPPGIALIKSIPSVVDITLDQEISKKLPVQINWTGKLMPHLILENVILKPDIVTVTGGKLKLKDMRAVYTEPFQLNDITKTGELFKVKPLQLDKTLILKNGKGEVEISCLVGERR
ncbi:MAG: diadenylate cyclase [Desulfobacterales bacterium]|nr:diadenylate cyclase [Desulfobacterales bacterium]